MNVLDLPAGRSGGGGGGSVSGSGTGGAHPRLCYAGFNQDSGCFVAGTRDGFRIYNADPLRQKSVHPLPAMMSLIPPSNTASPAAAWPTAATAEAGAVGVILAEMLFRCNYVALVLADRPRSVKIWDDLKMRFVADLEFNSPVKAVKLRRDRIVVVTPEIIKVFTFTSAPQSLHVFETPPNPRGLCSLSPSSENSLLAFPALENGQVRLFDLAEPEKPMAIVVAHSTRLCYLMLNVQGTKLATASEKGTLIRVFNASNGEFITELRRGTQPATIYSINFSSDSSLLCASSSHGTIHVFSLADPKRNKQSSLASSGFVNLSILPKYFASEWSFSRIEIPGATPCICAFGATPNSILAVCADGSYHKFLFEKNNFTRDVYQQFLELTEVS
ncbi:hypothetical protein TCAL_01583 [Tigriopus californicus]|uniref:WD repeat domain phosphoinositide-interacting protein 3 n=1 Tax=Tigriopus californicus TaxID=6832 RepID=A0A553P8S1_TIGCA|nr:WD repeat domain phosphoinositide-interacting protein 3-like [Tigriopus californicus]TRY74083.1 hypothetical protein TCAL_01583 [Tigriopus californicus]|eukprot:TCALIF_01583-PA protein Name:"Similar to wdr45b WD repeat domain phosphoinositide-interacting protein 3 (Danio rerio)" AED:0.05 eAED:0.05 QI:420/1/1/1/1/1/4/178/387